MPLKKIVKKLLGSEEEEVVELPTEEEATPKINVRVENLTGMEDVDRIMKLLKEGNILFLKTRDLQKKDIGQFQTTVQKMKRSCSQYGFDIVGTEEGYLICTPRFAKIER
jgi:SepF-like predicted cell division protein (DUF552 family)